MARKHATKGLVKDLRKDWDVRDWARPKMLAAADMIEELSTALAFANAGNVQLLERVSALNSENFTLSERVRDLEFRERARAALDRAERETADHISTGENNGR